MTKQPLNSNIVKIILAKMKVGLTSDKELGLRDLVLNFAFVKAFVFAANVCHS